MAKFVKVRDGFLMGGWVEDGETVLMQPRQARYPLKMGAIREAEDPQPRRARRRVERDVKADATETVVD